MTTSAELAEAAAGRRRRDIGDRLTDAGHFVAVGDLAPGESPAFTAPGARAPTCRSPTPGVYWIGVHALGTDDERPRRRRRRPGPDVHPVGQGAAASASDVARSCCRCAHEVRRDADGAARRPAAAGSTLLGRRRPARAACSARRGVGRATGHAAGRPRRARRRRALGAGQPGAPLDRGGDRGASSDPPPRRPEPDATPRTAAPRARTPPGSSDPAPPRPRLAARRRGRAGAPRARAWPYADPDVAALRPATTPRCSRRPAGSAARRRSTALGIDARPTVAPADGLLRRSGRSARSAHGHPVLLSDDACPGSTTRLVARPTGPAAVLADAAAASGGPDPDATTRRSPCASGSSPRRRCAAVAGDERPAGRRAARRLGPGRRLARGRLLRRPGRALAEPGRRCDRPPRPAPPPRRRALAYPAAAARRRAGRLAAGR